jgi:hypothetical protein
MTGTAFDVTSHVSMAGPSQQVGFTKQIIRCAPATVDDWLTPVHGISCQPLLLVTMEAVATGICRSSSASPIEKSLVSFGP